MTDLFLFFKSNGPFYFVPTGRRDGRISIVSHAANLPDVDDPIEILKSKFKEKGLSEKDLVLLSGGIYTHTISTYYYLESDAHKKQ